MGCSYFDEASVNLLRLEGLSGLGRWLGLGSGREIGGFGYQRY
jgi:hypothetical protein